MAAFIDKACLVGRVSIDPPDHNPDHSPGADDVATPLDELFAGRDF